MSGTSLDGIDLACVNFKFNKFWKFEVEATKTVSYSKQWITKFKELFSASKDLIKIGDESYTLFLAKNVLSFIKEFKLTEIDAICSHGHTLFHDPKNRLTFQLGNRKSLATETGLNVVCNFRSQDIELGGQGAPLVPIGEKLLFRGYDAFLNLGGFSNVSKISDKSLIAYDICAVNTILNFLANKRRKSYDLNGNMAKQGKLISPLFDDLESLEYYKKSPPKSLGIEWVNSKILPLLEKYRLQSVEDLLYTYTIHIGSLISKNFDCGQNVLVTGGGAKNNFLIKKIKENQFANFILPSKIIIDYKESIIFGFLGVLRLRNEINCLASVTGSSRDHCSGNIFMP